MEKQERIQRSIYDLRVLHSIEFHLDLFYSFFLTRNRFFSHYFVHLNNCQGKKKQPKEKKDRE